MYYILQLLTTPVCPKCASTVNKLSHMKVDGKKVWHCVCSGCLAQYRMEQ